MYNPILNRGLYVRNDNKPGMYCRFEQCMPMPELPK